jgi:hypothetical protein
MLEGMFCPTSGSSRDPSPSVGRPNNGWIGWGPLTVVGWEGSFEADKGDELRHRRPEAGTVVGLSDVHARRQDLIAIRQHLAGRRLVCDQRPDLLGMAGHQGEGIHGPATGGEDVDWSGVERRDQAVQVVGVLIGCCLGGPVGPLAPLRPRGS